MKNEHINGNAAALPKDRLVDNAETLLNEIAWFVKLVNIRLHSYFPDEKLEMTSEKKNS